MPRESLTINATNTIRLRSKRFALPSKKNGSEIGQVEFRFVSRWQSDYSNENTRSQKINKSLTEITDKQFARAQELWSVADELRDHSLRGGFSVLQAFVEKGIKLSLQDVEIVSNRLGQHNNFQDVPLDLADFIAELLSPLKIRKILDPYSRNGVLPLRLAERIEFEQFDAVSPFMQTSELVNLIGNKGVNFQIGNPLAMFNTDEAYDAIVSCPPFGMQSDPIRQQVNDKTIEVNDDLAHQLLFKSCLALKEGGVAVFVLTSSVFTKAARPKGALTALRKLGFNIVAAIDLPASTFRFTSISAQLVVVKKPEDEMVFTGRLPADEDSRKLLAANTNKRKQSGSLVLGFLAPRDGFRGFTPLELELNVKKQARRMGLEPIPFNQVFVECTRSQQGTRFKRFTDETDSVFLPQMANSPAATSQEQLSKKLRSYFKLVVNPIVADAEFVAELLNKPFGHSWRDSLKTGAVMSAISRTLLQESTFYLPPRKKQITVVGCHRQIENARSELSQLNDRLWDQPIQVDDILAELKPIQKEGSYEQWIDSLPFPLASILWVCHADSGSQYEQFHRKLLFFEAFSEFIALIHLSAFSSEVSIWRGMSAKIKEYLEQNKLSIENATWGTWNVINQTLVKESRKLLRENEQLCYELYRTTNRRLLEALTSKEILTVNQHTNTIRNKMKAHVGALSVEASAEINDKLHLFILQLRNIFGYLWEDYQLLLPGIMKFKSGVFKTQVQILQGIRQPFPTNAVEVLEALEENDLYFKSPNQQQALKLLPLLKVMTPPPNEQHACYFYNQKEKDGCCFLSYHCKTESRIVRPFQDTEKAIGRLFDTEFGFAD